MYTYMYYLEGPASGGAPYRTERTSRAMPTTSVI